jgi:hypothetical protein
MQRLQIQLFFGFDGHKSHPRTLHRLGNRFGIAYRFAGPSIIFLDKEPKAAKVDKKCPC